MHNHGIDGRQPEIKLTRIPICEVGVDPLGAPPALRWLPSERAVANAATATGHIGGLDVKGGAFLHAGDRNQLTPIPYSARLTSTRPSRAISPPIEIYDRPCTATDRSDSRLTTSSWQTAGHNQKLDRLPACDIHKGSIFNSFRYFYIVIRHKLMENIDIGIFTTEILPLLRHGQF